MTSCIFCDIVAGKEVCYRVWEDDVFLAFLDRHPLNAGHTLIIPKHHVPYVYNMESALYTDLFLAARRLEPAIRTATGAKRIGLAIEGFGVDHTHLHMIPIYKANEMDPHRARTASEEELRDMLHAIQAVLHV